MQKISFPSNKATVAGNLFLPQDVSKPPGILLLYGGGRHVTKELFADFQNELGLIGIVSLAIDFPGDGESSGEFSEGSLSMRLEYAKAAYKELLRYANPEKIAVYGGSMGGYIAARLVELFPQTKVLLLIAGAAYAKEAEDVPLNEEFTKILTTENSWKNSVSFDAVQNFQGNILVVYGENDTVIPKEIQNTYHALIKNRGKFVVIPEGSHRLFTPTTPGEAEAKEKTFQELLNYIKENL